MGLELLEEKTMDETRMISGWARRKIRDEIKDSLK